MGLKIKNVRLAFPSLWKKDKMEGSDGAPKFKATFILPKDHPQLDDIKKMIEKKIAHGRWRQILSGKFEPVFIAHVIALIDEFPHRHQDRFAQARIVVAVRGFDPRFADGFDD